MCASFLSFERHSWRNQPDSPHRALAHWRCMLSQRKSLDCARAQRWAELVAASPDSEKAADLENNSLARKTDRVQNTCVQKPRVLHDPTHGPRLAYLGFLRWGCQVQKTSGRNCCCSRFLQHGLPAMCLESRSIISMREWGRWMGTHEKQFYILATVAGPRVSKKRSSR